MIVFRPLSTLPATELAPLVERSVAEGFRFLTRLVDEWASGATRFDRAGELLLGGYDGARLVAVGGVTRDPYADDPTVGRLRHLYVMPSHRRLGVGRALVRALEAAAPGAYRELTLRTDTAAAAAFYEALGYTRLSPGGTATHRRAVPSSA